MNSGYSDILFSEDAGIARITLNRPAKRNAIAQTTLLEMSAALNYVKDSSNIRVVILTGAGSYFCAGGDLSMMAAALAGGDTQSTESPANEVSLAQLLLQMHALGKPIIAMVNGPALAGGLGLMLACDYVLASEEASYATSEIKIGLWPMMISAELVRNIGRKKALDLMLSGRRVLAPEALAIGLISEKVPAAELEASVMRLAQELSGRSPSALAMGLRSFYETQDLAFADALADLQQRFGELLTTPDAKEGLAAFVEKRAPQFGGD